MVDDFEETELFAGLHYEGFSVGVVGKVYNRNLGENGTTGLACFDVA